MSVFETEEYTELSIAIDQGDFDKVRHLIEDEKVDIDEMVKHDMTPLAIAVYQEELEIAKYLLEHGANPLLDNDYHEFPFEWETEKKLINYARQLMLEDIKKAIEENNQSPFNN